MDTKGDQFQDYQRPKRREPLLNLPKAVKHVLIALLAVHIIRLLLPVASDTFLVGQTAVIPARLVRLFMVDAGLSEMIGAPLTLLTYGFLHADWTHLLLNAGWLMAFGTVVAYRFGASRRSRRQFYVFFLICCVAGALVHVVIYPSSYQPLVGASAGISGLMGAALRILLIPPGASWRGSRPPCTNNLSTGLAVGGAFCCHQCVVWSHRLWRLCERRPHCLAGPFRGVFHRIVFDWTLCPSLVGAGLSKAVLHTAIGHRPADLGWRPCLRR